MSAAMPGAIMPISSLPRFLALPCVATSSASLALKPAHNNNNNINNNNNDDDINNNNYDNDLQVFQPIAKYLLDVS